MKAEASARLPQVDWLVLLVPVKAGRHPALDREIEPDDVREALRSLGFSVGRVSVVRKGRKEAAP